jgi:hypothetical protein
LYGEKYCRWFRGRYYVQGIRGTTPLFIAKLPLKAKIAGTVIAGLSGCVINELAKK